MYVELIDLILGEVSTLGDYINTRLRYQIILPYPVGSFVLDRENVWLRERHAWCYSNIGASLRIYDDEMSYMVTPNQFHPAADWHQNGADWRFHRETDAVAFKICWLNRL